ncbi:uncharacterized protein LOC111253996 isoform X2 [Varroa destructor]|uniref:Uncharacterized protein n=1 Tax=Varroa destructor TaxID=109461 RepID=A0A7M7KSN1_VARDE|nr:uncharacterized protein LOC111253996 isoform X2 [Varroa destructor]
MAVTVIPSSLLVVIVTMAILSQFSTPGNAFVKKLLETKLLASMMKELNNQPFYDKYSVSYSVPPLKLLPMNTDTVETTMPIPLITRMKMMKSPMDMYQLEHIAPYYKAAYSYFDHPAHQNHHHPDHEEPGITRHPDHSVQHHPHIEDHHFDHDHDDADDDDDNEHDHHYHHDHLAHFSDHEMYKQSSMNNMRNNLYSQATAVMKTGALKARPWPVPSRGLRKTNLDFNENFSLAEIEPTNSGFAMNAMNGEMGNFGPSVDVPSTIEGSMDISRGGIKNLNTAVEKIKQLNKNDDVSEISEEQMKRPITQNMEKDFENDESKKKNKNESLAEMKPANIDQLNIMKPLDMIAVSRNLTRLPAKTMNKTQNHGKMESILYSELTQNQGNRGSVYLSGVPPKMILPRYHTPMSPVQFTMRLPSSQNGANEVGQSLVGRMRNAMGNFGLGGTRRGNWNQLTANIAKFHDINQGTMGQRLTSAAQKIMLKPLMIPNSPPAMMDMYNSMPPFNLGMHPGDQPIFGRVLMWLVSFSLSYLISMPLLVPTLG